MVKRRIKDVNAVLRNYRKRLEEKIRIEQMILFGSYARGKPRDYSDIDIAVVSPDFKGGTEEDCLLLDRAAREITPLIEAFPYTPRELKYRERGSFLDEIVRTGKVVASESDAFEARARTFDPRKALTHKEVWRRKRYPIS